MAVFEAPDVLKALQPSRQTFVGDLVRVHFKPIRLRDRRTVNFFGKCEDSHPSGKSRLKGGCGQD